MAALTGYRNTLKMKDTSALDLIFAPIADNVKCFVGGMAALDVNGRIVAAGSATAVGPIVGKIEVPYQPQAIGVNPSPNTVYDNTVAGHVAGALNVAVRQGVFKWATGAAADAVVQANLFQDCYAIDDQTVSSLPTGGRSRAGKVVQVDLDGIWVATGLHQQSGMPGQSMILPVSLASLVVGGGTIAGPFTPGFFGKLIGLTYVSTVSGSGAGASFACNLQIGGVSTTGGVSTITLANTVYAGAPVVATAFTALNAFGPTSTLTLVNAAGTVFAGGTGYFIAQLAS